MFLPLSNADGAVAVIAQPGTQVAEPLLLHTNRYAQSATRIKVRKRICSEEVAIRGEDEIWLLNVRETGCNPHDLSGIRVCRRQCGEWCDAGLADLLAAHRNDPSRETVFFVHGYNTDEHWSVTRSLQAYRNLFSGNACRPAIRYVVVQWKSEQDALRLRRDYEAKAQLAIVTGKTMARMLDQFHNQNITMVGYSLGAQVSLSAMQELPAGNCATCVDGNSYRLALIAPALNSHFSKTFACGPGLSREVSATLVFRNMNDRVAKLAEGLARRRNRRDYVSLEELFNSGFSHVFNVRQFNVTHEVARKHSIDEYTRSITMQQQIALMLCASQQGNAGLNSGQYPLSDFLPVKPELAPLEPMSAPQTAPSQMDIFEPGQTGQPPSVLINE